MDHQRCDPEREKLVPGEVRIRCSLADSCMGWTYDVLNLEQKYLDGRQGVFIAQNVILNNGDKIKVKLMSEIEKYVCL